MKELHRYARVIKFFQEKMAAQIEALVGGLILPEGVHWDQDTQSLYFVDTNDRSIYRYAAATKTYVKATLGTGSYSNILFTKIINCYA